MCRLRTDQGQGRTVEYRHDLDRSHAINDKKKLLAGMPSQLTEKPEPALVEPHIPRVPDIRLQTPPWMVEILQLPAMSVVSTNH